MINRGDIKLAIDMVVNAQDDQLFGGEAEYVINTLEDCGNTIAAQAAVIESFKSALTYVIEDLELRASLKEDKDERGVVDIGCGAYDQAKEALAIPTDSTQILTEVRRAEREKCADVCEKSDRYRGDYFASKIRAME